MVGAHLDAEEATTIPVLLARVARRDYLAATHAAIHATGADGDIKLFAFVAPWLLPACTPDQVERVYAKLPRMVRHVNRFVWVPRYERAFPAWCRRWPRRSPSSSRPWSSTPRPRTAPGPSAPR